MAASRAPAIASVTLSAEPVRQATILECFCMTESGWLVPIPVKDRAIGQLST